MAVFRAIVPAPPPGRRFPCGRWVASTCSRALPGEPRSGFMPVVPMVVVSVLLMLVVAAHPEAERPTVERYFRLADPNG